MQFITIASALFATALAAPTAQKASDACPNPAHCGEPIDIANYENIIIKDFFVRKTGDNIVAADFKLTGDDITDVSCEIGKVDSLPSTVTTCETSNYRFSLTKGKETDFGLTIYHQTGQASGKWGDGDVPTHCRAGGAGADDMICGQVGQVTTVISS